MSGPRVAAPWKLSCPWCEFYIIVNARGMRGMDAGAGVEAARTMQDHLKQNHPSRSWQQFLEVTRE